jgi:tetraacyldisaccharide 4'-kinase
MSAGARRLLFPLVPIYRLALALREMRFRTGREPVRRLRYPVISIGNLSTGGSGKTPLTIALAQALTRRGLAVDVLSRGYGRTGAQAARVDPAGSAADFGDEPLLIAGSAGVPVYVARQRYDAGLLAESVGTYPNDRSVVHLLDDGFQHRQLHRDIDILLLSRDDWRDRLLPAGNLREALPAAKRASVIAIPSDDRGFEQELHTWGWPGPVWRLRRSMDVPHIDGPVVAFCGIARPKQFFSGLVSAGLHVPVAIGYPDHHRFNARNLEAIVLAARTHGAVALVTTEKDLVRLGPLAASLPVDLPLYAVPLRVEIEDETAAVDWLMARLKSCSNQTSL